MANAKTVALIPGSNRGIGFETARAAKPEGITVILTAGSANEAADLTRKLQEEGY